LVDPTSAQSGWDTFYEIIGSSGAALIGIQFVVIALIVNLRRAILADPIAAYATPTVVHLCAALVVSAVMCAPWPWLVGLQLTLAICGLLGLAYGAIVIRRSLRQTDYKPVWEDWIWYATLPCALYGGLALAGALLRARPHFGMFVAGGSTLGLLLVGIHNAWDTVTHLVLQASAAEPKKTESAAAGVPTDPMGAGARKQADGSREQKGGQA
jgi:hypothetical protein